MKRVNRISAAALILFGLVVCLESVRLGIVEEGRPGSGFWPLIWAAVVVLLAGIQVANPGPAAARGPRWPRGEGLKKVATFTFALLIYVPVTQNLGFLISSLVFLGLLLKYPGRYGWVTVVVMSVGMSLVLYVGLDRFLGVELPKGIMATVGL